MSYDFVLLVTHWPLDLCSKSNKKQYLAFIEPCANGLSIKWDTETVKKKLQKSQAKYSSITGMQINRILPM